METSSDTASQSKPAPSSGPSLLRRSLAIILPLGILALAFGVVFWLKHTKPEVAAKPAEEKVWTVAVQPAVPKTVQPMIDVFGEIAASREAELRALVQGRIIDVAPDFLEGARVEAGTLLVTIDPFAFEAALAEAEADLEGAMAEIAELEADLAGERAQLAGDKSQVALANADVLRREKLFRDGAGSQKSLDDARLSQSQRAQALAARTQTIARLEARLAQARSKLDRLNVVVRRAERDLAETKMRAPYTGFLSAVDAAVGMRVSANDRLASLTVAQSLEARFHVSDSQFARLMEEDGFKGRPVQVIWTLGESTVSFEGRIDRAEAAIDAARGGMRLFATLADVGLETALRPGAFVTVRVPDKTFEGVIAIPPRALHRTDDRGDAVYILRDGRLVQVPITVVGRDRGDLLVRGDQGLSDTPEPARIVTSRFPEMGPGVAAKAAALASEVK